MGGKRQKHAVSRRRGEYNVFEKVVKLHSGAYALDLGKVTIILKSRTRAGEFFNVLTRARRVYELDTTFDWNWTKADVEAFEKALKKSSVLIPPFELEEFQRKNH
ncbi:hypothetical protein BCR41DRAFT_373252 [Lobosporangium transversale]|uniref:Uncharacterized protein n=1 Tax=Lobosporangium transversale TaxID=64571 RepID=A0A1Y2GIN1_9FUNG|nr:hypothetical protein BCR41DRAFT_373252 [Lobosporangium transversale]ORZ08552.1 hypothetical protein BCR41DRAFT_373252 [Lobosporangium transversale]|eukprot:XP_021878480.1 hypothetical protein BCR41DRAFT_373252 [Lobosporangium transversale]